MCIKLKSMPGRQNNQSGLGLLETRLNIEFEMKYHIRAKGNKYLDKEINNFSYTVHQIEVYIQMTKL